MASTITDQLASASGPMTGSGSALNQLGLSQQQAGYYRDQAIYPASGAPPGDLVGSYAPGQHHQSRYDSHYGGARSHRSLAANYPGSASQAATTTAGAYHLDRNELLMGEQAEQQRHTMHQSLGNLHHSSGGAGQAALRYGGANQEAGFIMGAGHQQQDRYLDQVASHRAGSMPPLGYSGGAQLTETTGLGSYNPLDDPLASRGQFQQDFGASGGQYFGPNQHIGGPQQSRDLYLTELRARLLEAQNSYATVKRELETATQKLGSSMHSIKSFWSPELKKERALRKEEATKYALINDQMKLMRVEVQVSVFSLAFVTLICHRSSNERNSDKWCSSSLDLPGSGSFSRLLGWLFSSKVACENRLCENGLPVDVAAGRFTCTTRRRLIFKLPILLLPVERAVIAATCERLILA